MTKIAKILATSLFAAAAYAQPSVDPGRIVNAASYAAPGLANGSIAQGSLFVVFGRNMGPAAIQIVDRFPVPTNLGGTSVKVSVGGTTVDALMIYTLASQIAAVLPSNTPLGTGTATVSYNGQASAAVPITVVKSSFGIFTRNQGGSGPAIVQNVNSETNRPTNALTDSARPGQVMVLWGTGLGPVTGEANGPVPGDLPLDVEVLLGGRSVAATYKGRSGCCAGIDQIVFTVPTGVEGCFVPLAVRVGTVVSNYTSMSIAASGSNCSDTSGFSAADLEKAKSGNFRLGALALARVAAKTTVPGFGSIEIKTDLGSGTFSRFDLNGLLASSGANATPSLGSCTILTAAGSTAPTGSVLAAGLDAGASLNVNGPKGAKSLAKAPGANPGVYSGQLSSGTPNIPGLPGGGGDYLDAGAYTVTGPGGADVGSFSANITLPAPLTWSNQDSINDVTRSQGVTVTWTGGAPSDYVQIFGVSSSQTGNVTGSFVCTERASAGRFTVPASLLANLPASGQVEGAATGALSVGSAPATPARFTATGIDAGFLTYVVASVKILNYR